MSQWQVLSLTGALLPAALMAIFAGICAWNTLPVQKLWRGFIGVSVIALVTLTLQLAVNASTFIPPGVLTTTPLILALALLVQLLGTVIGTFSNRYLQGESGQRRYIAALTAVLASVQLLLIADHWLLLIAAWASVGIALQTLLCFYPDRPFALLAAHKKRLADRLADLLLLAAATLAWGTVGSGSLSALWLHIAQQGMSPPLQFSAVALVLAVVLRTALLPVHGWLIQVMEAPTPVSALLHAGVVNLGGFVLIRFAPMLEQAAPARTLLFILGLATAVLAGLVMLTRISIKVRLAWSTVAQMGFMLLECALGLYMLAALHLIGHSLYKAHSFLSASSAVRETRLQALHGTSHPAMWSLVLAPLITSLAVYLVLLITGHTPWPWWWSIILGVAWAPALWMPKALIHWYAPVVQTIFGLVMIAGLTLAAIAAHALPLGIENLPHSDLGLVALLAMAGLYFLQLLIQRNPQSLSTWRRWSYAGFYLDEAYTRLALHIWPTTWVPASARRDVLPSTLADNSPVPR